MQALRWGIISTGFIADKFAEGLKTSQSGRLEAVCSRSAEQAKSFAARHGATRIYSSVSDLLRDRAIDAIYIASPHPLHAELAAAAIDAGKHTLCEKPIGMNARQVESIFDRARQAGVHVMEAYMYRCHPQTARVAEIIASGAIGTPRLVQASFGFNAPFSPDSRLYRKELGGGAILDVGGYPVSFAYLVAEASGQASPVALHGTGTLHPQTGADTLSVATLKFESGLVAQVSVGIQANQDNRVRVFGDQGSIEIPEPWIIAREGGDWSFTVRRDGAPAAETVAGTDSRGLYGIEADHFAAIVRGEATVAPGMPRESSLLVNGLLDKWRADVGVAYDSDQE